MSGDSNPLLALHELVPFDVIRPEHVVPAIERLLARAQEEADAIGRDPLASTYEATLGRLETATEPLEIAMTLVGHLESVATTPPLREAYNRVKPEVSAFYAGLPLNEGLYRALKAATAAKESLSPTRRRHLERTLDEFRRSGAELPAAGKARLLELSRELAQATLRYAQNVLDSTASWELLLTDEARLAGLPASAIAAAEQSARAKGLQGWRFTLQEPSVVPLLTYLDDRAIREQVYRAYNRRATEGELDNRPLISRILELRREQAQLLGYSSFADLVLEDRMAKDGAQAMTFVADLTERTEAFFERERAELQAFRRELEGASAPELAPWDLAYYAEKQRRARYDFDEEALRPYFSLPSVVRGLFETAERLYGIQIISARGVPVWHSTVEAFEVRDGGALLGRFYADFFPREEKRGGAWMNGLITGEVRHDRSTPHLALISTNVTPPIGDQPALLTHREVETLFHEFGHLLHHLLSRVEVRSLGGTNVAWDFVELPSQIMENWCWERAALDLFARHHQTGAAIPEDLFQKMKRARTYRAASAMMRQLGFATVDLSMHVQYRPERDGDPVAYARQVMSRFSPAPLPDGYSFVTSFGHLFASEVGYAAGYYSYKWAEVLDADAFTRFLERGIFDRSVGDAFRRNILERGNSAEPMELYRSFMGREPRLEPLLERSGLRAG